jgi:hypothetical protein
VVQITFGFVTTLSELPHNPDLSFPSSISVSAHHRVYDRPNTLIIITPVNGHQFGWLGLNLSLCNTVQTSLRNLVQKFNGFELTAWHTN